ncbi:MAG TPA: GHKL domain-containing protein [Candidatus Onthocola gallistercoris]|uniref:histidine kinase n=1 Tax=Candidatus Onthocola gallistercoris TaxID=2840876 RepID=A0A9D1HFS7_9FIRM|nr:GHKL domain-containing protein [Candidatus Onthocola gallistercoris]
MGIRWKRSKQTYGPKKPGRIRRWITYWRNHWRDLKWLYVFSVLIGAYFIQQAYDFIAYRSYPAIINIYVSGILMIALFVLMFGQIQKDTSSPGFMTWMKNWNMDTLIILYVAFLLAGLVAVILSASALFWYYNAVYYYYYPGNQLFILFVFLAMIHNALVMIIIRHFKDPALRNATWTKKVIKNISSKIQKKNLEYQKKYDFDKKNRIWINGLALGMLLVGLWQISGILSGGRISFFSVLLFLLLLTLLLYWLKGHLGFLSDVGIMVREIHNMSEGNAMDLSEIPEDSMICEAKEDLTHIHEDLAESIQKQVRSEKMKVDLITNVSHDLKTPLTSIIGYIDLLKKMELSDEARDYVDILAQKSERLKAMIQDVFEVSKATSGNADMRIEQLDICKLLIQTLGDMEDKIERSGRTIKRNMPEEGIYVMADGHKLYRIYQNIMENALKYSLEGTRIYVDVTVERNQVQTVVKNISSYEMNFTEETITERFTRGDVSRTTEGHGLGLAIVKSFSEACGGRFHIDIDGDLFKAILTFPCVEYEEAEGTEDQKVKVSLGKTVD